MQPTKTLYRSRHISTSIQAYPQEVYRFASNPENLPRWAAGVSSGIRKAGDDWITDSPMGAVKIRFTKQNNAGILDHEVTLPSGETVYNPMRVFPNSTGSEVVFTLYRLPGMSPEQFEADAQLVIKYLHALKNILETNP